MMSKGAQQMATETTLSAPQIADKLEQLDVPAFAWLLSLEFTHDEEAEDAKKLIVRALRAYRGK